MAADRIAELLWKAGHHLQTDCGTLAAHQGVNTEQLAVLRRVLGDPTKVLRGHGASMVAEDFSFFGRAGVPATLALLGVRNESAGAVGFHMSADVAPGRVFIQACQKLFALAHPLCAGVMFCVARVICKA